MSIVTKTPDFSTSIGTALGAFFVAILTHTSIVLIAAASGLILGYLFQGTMIAALAALGLGAFSLWQVGAIVATAAIVLKPLVSIFK